MANKLTDKWVLIVEDEEFNFILIREILEELDVNIVWAQSGMEAIDIVKKTPELDIILMDIRLPFMSGYEATKRIRKIRPDILVIAQTAFVQADIVEKCFESGCDAYISKPYTPTQLVEVVRKYYISA